VVPNPFKPTAGANPPLLVGRDTVIEEFLESIDDGPGAPGRITIFSGPRGIGKTVMLNAVADQVQASHQWLTIHETATPGFLERITRAAAQHLDPQRRSLTGFALPTYLGGGGLNFAPDHEPTAPNFRETATLLLDQCESHQTGLLITIDEIRTSSELIQLAADVQHLVREDRDIAIALAGIPSAVNELLNDQLATFLRRANRQDLDDVPLVDVAQALQATINENGRTIDPDALTTAATATGGYPFMIQLVGYHTWRRTTTDHIRARAVTAGIQQARTRLGSLVHAAALRELSDVDRTFLVAMAQDDGPSRIAEIARRLNKDPQYANVYRSRLIAAGMIIPAGYGQVDFAIPYLRDYLIEHAAHHAMTTQKG
jgi:hypothetical protein